MADTKKIGDMIDNVINGKDEQAEIDFHEYLPVKTQEVLYNKVNTETKQLDNIK